MSRILPENPKRSIKGTLKRAKPLLEIRGRTEARPSKKIFRTQ